MREQIGKYAIQKELGHGGMGVVYRATDPVIGRDVAIKMLLERALKDPALKKRVYREARSAGRLSHENIMTIYDVGEEDGHPYLVMELLDGTDLRDVLDGPEELSLDAKLDIAVQIARGLRYAHDHDTIHRDIKPANVRICSSGRVKILDFGIARIQTETRTSASAVIGTPRYMSPEQVKGESIDRRTDIFSFGVLLYEMLAGTPPFLGDTVTAVIYKILHADPAPFALEDDRSSGALQGVVSRCLEKEVADRYQEFGEVIDDLEAIRKRIRDDSTLVDPPQPEPTPVPPWWSNRAASVGVGAVLLALVLGVWAFWGAGEASPPPLAATNTAEELPVLRSSVDDVRQRMETARSAADEAGAAGETLYAQAEQSAEAGREAMETGTEAGLEEAHEAFTRAEGLYEAAAAAVLGPQPEDEIAAGPEPILAPAETNSATNASDVEARRERIARQAADGARDDMQTARQAVSEQRADVAIATDFDRAETLRTSGEQRYESGDYAGAASSFGEAESLYATMATALSESATQRQRAEQVRAAMRTAKQSVPANLNQQPAYRQAETMEQDADRAFAAGTYEEAASLYAQAETRFAEVAEAEAPPAALADVARGASQAVQQRLAGAVETADWSGLPAPVTSLYRDQVDGIRTRFNIGRVVTVPGAITADGDGATATQPMTVYIHYTQKGRTEEKTVSLAHTWVWARAGDTAELVRIQ